jgi:hypothetical protein
MKYSVDFDNDCAIVVIAFTIAFYIPTVKQAEEKRRSYRLQNRVRSKTEAFQLVFLAGFDTTLYESGARQGISQYTGLR